MPLDENMITESFDRYWREIDRYEKLSRLVADKCRNALKDKSIRCSVNFRAKDPDRLKEKLRKHIQEEEKRNRYSSADDVFTKVGDLAGVRITTYVEKDRDKVVDIVKQIFKGSEPDDSFSAGEGKDIDKKDDAGSGPKRFYRATHVQVIIKDDELIGTDQNLRGVSCEIQICSLLAHVYNEIEHDIRYKPVTGEPSLKENDLLNAIGQLTAAGDVIVETVIEAQQERHKQSQGEFEDIYDFITRMRGEFTDSGNFDSYAWQLYDELLALGLNSPEKIKSALFVENHDTESKRLVSRLKTCCDQDNIVNIDETSSDRLLVLLLSKRLNDVIERHPAGQGMGRPPRIRSTAKKFREMLTQPEPNDGSQNSTSK